MRALLVFVLVGCAARSATPPSNTATAPQPANQLVAYLRNAERQLETPDQEAELRRALEELATLRPDQLGNGYEKILKSYLVPDPLVAIDEAEIHRDAQQPAARTLLRAHIQAIDEHRQLHTRPSLLRE